jgi:hypothetical protein
MLKTFKKCSILPAHLNPYLMFNRGSRPRKAKILTTPVQSAGPGAGRNTLSMLKINPPMFGGGLKFETDTGIGQKGSFCKGLHY